MAIMFYLTHCCQISWFLVLKFAAQRSSLVTWILFDSLRRSQSLLSSFFQTWLFKYESVIRKDRCTLSFSVRTNTNTLIFWYSGFARTIGCNFPWRLAYIVLYTHIVSIVEKICNLWFQTFECCPTGYVINRNASMGVAEVSLWYRLESFLTSCVPELKLDNSAIYFNLFYFEINTDSTVLQRIENVLSESQQHWCLSRSWITQHYYFV